MSPIESLALLALAAMAAAAVYLVAGKRVAGRRAGTTRRTALAVGIGSVALISLAACGSSSSSEATPTPSSPATSSSSNVPSGSDTQAACTSEAILAQLPGGATMQKFNCANAGGQEWAAARVNPGNTVFFLKWDGNAWQAETSGDVCGTASAGVPTELLSYCAGPSSSPSPAAATCTSQALLAQLPGGATMQKYTCASAGGQEWAAARVNPGNTVFFLKWDGKAWQAETSGAVCGTASAGLPAQLLAYCKA